MTNSRIIIAGQKAMDIDVAADLIKRTLELAFLITSPVLAGVFIVGVLISIFQAATQINEMTLTFVPKLLLALVIMYFLANWFLIEITDFTKEVWNQIPEFVK
jgi:flagellar biosynthetic protein FliQ